MLWTVPSDCASERSQDDQWAPHRPTSEPVTVLSQWSSQWRGVLQGMSRQRIGKERNSTAITMSKSIPIYYVFSIWDISFVIVAIWEAALWPVLLPCLGSREEKVWTPWMEHSLRIQWVRSQDIHHAVTGTLILTITWCAS